MTGLSCLPKEGTLSRIETLSDGRWTRYSHPELFSKVIRGGIPVVRIGGGHDPAALFRMLVVPMAEPFVLVYVLHSPRSGARAGRYQSPKMTVGELRLFLERFFPFLSTDARHDLWVLSPTEQGAVLWDRHDLLTACGPLDHCSETLETLGFRDGNVSVPDPHRHAQDHTLDGEERDLLAALEGSWSELKPEEIE